jgi:multidrug efflux pump subunit AcrA (membrane-fusion protein)
MFVIPGSAVGNDQQGDFVYVVGADDVVQRRAIVKGPMTASGLAIRSGVAATDRVIVNGLLNARPGAKVSPQTAPPVPAPAPTVKP